MACSWPLEAYHACITHVDKQECGDEISPTAYLASICLNTGRWLEAADWARKLQGPDASESLVAAFALFELGRMEDAMASFLRGALNYPRAARILAGIRTESPKGYDQAQDYNAGVDISRNLESYLLERGRRSKRFFKDFLNRPHVIALLTEIEEVRRKWHDQHRTGERAAFDRMTQMQRPEFARRELEKMSGSSQ